VTITEVGKSTSTTYTTDDEGLSGPFSDSGDLRGGGRGAGIQEAIINGVVVQIDQKARTDSSLEVGQLSEVAEVDPHRWRWSTPSRRNWAR
jgi:hypothetical protein